MRFIFLVVLSLVGSWADRDQGDKKVVELDVRSNIRIDKHRKSRFQSKAASGLNGSLLEKEAANTQNIEKRESTKHTNTKVHASIPPSWFNTGSLPPTGKVDEFPVGTRIIAHCTQNGNWEENWYPGEIIKLYSGVNNGNNRYDIQWEDESISYGVYWSERGSAWHDAGHFVMWSIEKDLQVKDEVEVFFATEKSEEEFEENIVKGTIRALKVHDNHRMYDIYFPVDQTTYKETYWGDAGKWWSEDWFDGIYTIKKIK